jgi:hydrogenase maturation protease
VGRRILVACIGNIFLGDDAFGVEVARRFADRSLPEGVQVVDFGIRSYDLAYALMEDWDLVILVDAVPRGGQPGTIYVTEPELPAPDAPQATTLDAHTMNPVAVLQMVEMLRGETAPVGAKFLRSKGSLLVVGCEPSPADPEEAGMELSAPVKASVDEAIRVIEGLISRFPATSTVGTVRSREDIWERSQNGQP